MLEIIAGLIMLYLLWKALEWLFIHVLVPVFTALAVAGKWVLIIGGSIGLAIGAIAAVVCYVMSVREHWDPYAEYDDKSPNKEEAAARRSYFFGPGYLQLKNIFLEAVDNIADVISQMNETRKSFLGDDDGCLTIVLFVPAWVIFLAAAISVGVVGGAITLAIGALHAAVIVAVMAVTYALFSVTWLVDRIYLEVKSVRTICPVDQTRVVIPHFRCPYCDRVHERLVPGPYGIWRRECQCGAKLPTTFFLGRSRLTALCPKCGHELAASDVRQFSVSLVGGASSGKTVLLSALFHEFFEQVRGRTGVRCHIPGMHQADFDQLETWFNGAECPATADVSNARMYSALLRRSGEDIGRQFTLYDIAGEAFDDATLSRIGMQQLQLADSNGVIIAIDPLSSPKLREAASVAGDDIANHSEADAAEVISNFATYLKVVLTGRGLEARCDKPVAVVITKADLTSVACAISHQRIQAELLAHPDRYESFIAARDALCRQFLSDIDMTRALDVLDANFSNVHFFPVSAIGHAPNGEAFSPDHVTDPLFWIIRQTDPELAQTMGID